MIGKNSIFQYNKNFLIFFQFYLDALSPLSYTCLSPSFSLSRSLLLPVLSFLSYLYLPLSHCFIVFSFPLYFSSSLSLSQLLLFLHSPYLSIFLSLFLFHLLFPKYSSYPLLFLLLSISLLILSLYLYIYLYIFSCLSTSLRLFYHIPPIIFYFFHSPFTDSLSHSLIIFISPSLYLSKSNFLF